MSTSPVEPHNPSRQQPTFYRNVVIALVMVLAMWTVKMIETSVTGSLSDYGLRPGDLKGLIGVLTMPFLHGDFDHLQSNTFGILITVILGLQIYPRSFWRSFLLIYFLGHTLTWFFARNDAVHIGASGVIYGLWGFLLMGAFIRRDRPAGGAAMVVVLLFAGMIWGTLPIWIDKSWEGHLFGMISGFVAAGLFASRDRTPPKLWPEETEANQSNVHPIYDQWDNGDRPPEEVAPVKPVYTPDHDQQIIDPAWRNILDQWERDIEQDRFRNRTPND